MNALRVGFHIVGALFTISAVAVMTEEMITLYPNFIIVGIPCLFFVLYFINRVVSKEVIE